MQLLSRPVSEALRRNFHLGFIKIWSISFGPRVQLKWLFVVRNMYMFAYPSKAS